VRRGCHWLPTTSPFDGARGTTSCCQPTRLLVSSGQHLCRLGHWLYLLYGVLPVHTVGPVPGRHSRSMIPGAQCREPCPSHASSTQHALTYGAQAGLPLSLRASYRTAKTVCTHSRELRAGGCVVCELVPCGYSKHRPAPHQHGAQVHSRPGSSKSQN